MGRGRQPATGKGISPSRLRKRLEAGDIEGLYLILGEDAFLRRRAIEALTSAIVGDPPADPGLACDRFDAGESTFAEILDSARSLPLFLPVRDRPVRLIRITGFDPTGFEEVEILSEYLDCPVPETCLVFEVPKLDRRPKASKLLLQHGVEVDCTAPSAPRDIARWIVGKADSMGFALEPDAVSYLIEMTGNNLQQIDQELQKLAIFVGDRQRIGAKDLEALMQRSREHSVFELTDALVARDGKRSVEVLNFLYDDGATAFEILPMIAWIVRQMVIAGDLIGQGLPEREVEKHLRVRWDTKRAVLRRAKGCTVGQLQSLLVACAEADIPAKMRRGNAERGTLEALCRRVCAA